jgi:hypothetical protein
MIRYKPELTSQLLLHRNVENVINLLTKNLPQLHETIPKAPLTYTTVTNEIENVYAIDYVMRDFLTKGTAKYIDIRYYTPLERPKNNKLTTHIWVDKITKSYPEVFVLLDRRNLSDTYEFREFCRMARVDN